MDLEKIYHDQDGNECNIFQMVKREPAWAANILQQGEIAIAELRALKEHATQQAGSADPKTCRFVTCGFADKCKTKCDWASGN